MDHSALRHQAEKSYGLQYDCFAARVGTGVAVEGRLVILR